MPKPTNAAGGAPCVIPLLAGVFVLVGAAVVAAGVRLKNKKDIK